ncbi:MAG: CCA tRNA nucleotidyltransferase [Negativicutes bacterium]|nr:CCA tRNA nucleotidyltransferase [Negativicutes bacterium]
MNTVMRNNIPEYVQIVLKALAGAGHQAYLVGGAVRDMLIGRTPKDYDIATDAAPEQISRIAASSGWRVAGIQGLNFGVVLAVVLGNSVEIASYRGERYGEDSHRPAEVWLAKSIEEDLGRRDFTLNALAMNAGGDLIDPYGGQADARAGIIRAVGDPAVRFKEDALRMFRACRFAAELGFRIEENTLRAMGQSLNRINGLALERVRAELDRTLLAPYCDRGIDAMARGGLLAACCRVKERGQYRPVAILPEVLHLVDLPQNREYHRYDVWAHTLHALREVPPEPAIRWAALLHDCGKGLAGIRAVDAGGKITDCGHERKGAELAEAALLRLRLPDKVKNRTVWLVSRHMRLPLAAGCLTPIIINRWLREEARSGCFAATRDLVEAVRQLTRLCLADIKATGMSDEEMPEAEAMAATVLAAAERMPVHTADIAYESAALRAALGEARLIGPCLRNLLKRIQDGNLANEPQAVLAAAERWASRYAARSQNEH